MIQIEKAEPFFCVPAVLASIVKYYGYVSLNQTKISEQFIINTNTCTEQNTWGLTVCENDLNKFFCKNNIKLKEEYYSIRLFYDEYDMLKFIESKIKTAVVICGYNHSALYGNRLSNYNHVSIIDSTSENLIYILDPGPKNYGKNCVSLEKLFYAIKIAQDGLWCISPL